MFVHGKIASSSIKGQFSGCFVLEWKRGSIMDGWERRFFAGFALHLGIHGGLGARKWGHHLLAGHTRAYKQVMVAEMCSSLRWTTRLLGVAHSGQYTHSFYVGDNEGMPFVRIKGLPIIGWKGKSARSRIAQAKCLQNSSSCSHLFPSNGTHGLHF